MELARQIISIDKRLRSNTARDLKEFNSHSLSAQAKRRATGFFDARY